MTVSELMKAVFLKFTDRWFAKWPAPAPGPERLRHARIISHRGEHDNIRIFENTLAAFDAADRAGVWGIELDIQWTRDFEPVVIHDIDALRVFRSPIRIHETSLSELRSLLPAVPSLAEVIERYGRRRHLMIELKPETLPRPHTQFQILKRLTGPLTPQRDFHFLSLVSETFTKIDFVPQGTCILVAEVNIRKQSDLALKKGFGGFAGHYALITRKRLARHHRQGQQVGTGFIYSRRCLYREINRGVDWVFSNRAVKLQEYCGNDQK